MDLFWALWASVPDCGFMIAAHSKLHASRALWAGPKAVPLSNCASGCDSGGCKTGPALSCWFASTLALEIVSALCSALSSPNGCPASSCDGSLRSLDPGCRFVSAASVRACASGWWSGLDARSLCAEALQSRLAATSWFSSSLRPVSSRVAAGSSGPSGFVSLSDIAPENSVSCWPSVTSWLLLVAGGSAEPAMASRSASY